MNIGLLGTGFGQAHARIYHGHEAVDRVVVFGRTPSKLDQLAGEYGFSTTTEIDRIYNDATIDLIDVCLPTSLHADHVVRAVQAGKHVLCELPLATTLADGQRVVDAHAASDRQVFVDMAGRFDPATEYLSTAITSGTHGPLKTLQFETRTALLWEGYDIGLDSLAMDVMHGTLDTIVSALGLPGSVTAFGVTRDTGAGSAADVLLGYRDANVHCTASALMPKPYGMRGGYRAVFDAAVIESTWTAGWDGRPTGTLEEYSEQGALDVDLPTVDTYAAVIDHVFDCLAGRATSRLAPASVLDGLRLTLGVRSELTGSQNR